MDSSVGIENVDQPASSGDQAEHRLSRAERFGVNADGVDEIALAQSTVVRRDGERGGVGVLLVSHGSHSPSWRHMLLDVQSEVADDLLAIPAVVQARSAFMEYTEPSIATQLRAFDSDGIETVVVVPLLLTISGHSFDDIPAICGMNDDAEIVANLLAEEIEIYSPTARLIFAPLLDFTNLVQTNLTRRLERLVGSPDEIARSDAGIGIALIGYGSGEFDREWNEFFDKIGRFAETELGVEKAVHAWCGHLVDYDRRPTIDAIDGLLSEHARVVVVPIFVAYDPMFHQKIIGRAVERCSEPERVIYSNDAILPEPDVGRWVVDIASSMVAVPAT